MSQPAIYPIPPQQNMQLQENPANNIESHLLAKEDHIGAPIAQLPVNSTETHNIQHGTSHYPRSQSMPLPNQNNFDPPAPSSLTPSFPTSSNGEFRSSTAAKIEHIKNWSISTYKCTKQLIAEKLGKSSRTVDTELEAQIEHLREMQRKYFHILKLARALASHFQNVVIIQQGMGEAFADLAQKSPELQSEFLCNAETQRSLSRHGEVLLAALNFFVSSVNTLVNKTMEDTLLTIKRYETARIEYDAYRSDLETLLPTMPAATSSSSGALLEAQRAHDMHKAEFEKLRGDVSVKLKFLDENRVKVMHKQLLLFHNAVSAYFSGNHIALEGTLKQFNIKMKTGNAGPSSWVEQ